MANPKKKFNFYFDLKIYFIYFLILSLREERESYKKKNLKERKLSVAMILATKIANISIKGFI
jgi:hypothetical protein